MPLQKINEDLDTLPCGNCNKPLQKNWIERIYIFDHDYEIANEIKDGTINYCKCQSCGFHGWFWGGFLVINRSNGRAIFVDNMLFSESTDKNLSKLLEQSSKYLNKSELMNAQNNLVRVTNYKHIYDIIRQDDIRFKLESDAFKYAYKRRTLEDPKAWSLQFIEDSIELKAFYLLVDEESQARLEVLQIELQKRLKGDFNDDKLKSLFEKFVEMVNAKLPKLGGRHLDEFVNIDFDLIKKRIQKEIYFSLEKAFFDFQDSIQAFYPQAGDDEKFATVKNSILLFDQSFKRIDSNEAKKIEISQQVKQIAQRLKQHRASLDESINKELSVDDLLDQGTEVDDDLLFQLMIGVLSKNQHNAKKDFAVDYLQYLSYINFLKPSNIRRYGGLVLAAQYYNSSGLGREESLLNSLVAITLLQLDLEAGMDRSYYDTAGIIFQRLGRFHISNGNPELGGLHAGFSSRFFAFLKRENATLRSRLDAINSSVNNFTSEELISQSFEILTHIRNIKKDDKLKVEQIDELVNFEIECLSILASEYFKLWDGKFTAAETRANTEEKLEDSKITILADRGKEKTDVNYNHGEDDNVIIMFSTIETISEGLIIFHVLPIGLKWYDFLNEAIGLAENRKLNDKWESLYSTLIQMASDINIDGIIMYYWRLMFTLARNFKFAPPSNQTIVTILHIILAQFTRKTKISFADDSVLSGALRLILEKYSNPENTYAICDGESHISGLNYGEILEYYDHYDEAINAYLEASEKADTVLKNASYGKAEKIRTSKTTGIYRAARAALKKYKKTAADEDSMLVLNLLEAYRSKSSGKIDVKYIPENELIKRLNVLNIESIKKHLGEDQSILFFSLLHSSNLNDGFWYSAILNPPEYRMESVRFIEFNSVYDPYNEVLAAYTRAIDNLTGKSIDEVLSEIDEIDGEFRNALKELGHVLFPEELISELESRSVKRLIIIPDSYLFNIPMASLIVQKKEKCDYLFTVNDGLEISIRSNWSYIPVHKVKVNPLYTQSTFSLSVANNITWKEVSPIYGVNKFVSELKTRVSSYLNESIDEHMEDDLNHSVNNFLKSLRLNKIVAFFGHGEIDDNNRSSLITKDGPIGEYEVDSAAVSGKFSAEFAILCACSSINSAQEISKIDRRLSGPHIAMLRGGVSCIVGSLQPLLPIVAVELLDSIVSGLIDEKLNINKSILSTYVHFINHEKLNSPLFWGQIACFGQSAYQIDNNSSN